MPLQDAALALTALAAGNVPDRAQVLSGALALQTLVHRGQANTDLLDAAAGLETVATGGVLELDEVGRKRATELALAVRRVAAQLEI